MAKWNNILHPWTHNVADLIIKGFRTDSQVIFFTFNNETSQRKHFLINHKNIEQNEIDFPLLPWLREGISQNSDKISNFPSHAM